MVLPSWLNRLTGRRTFDEALAHYERVLATRAYKPKTLQQRTGELRHLRAAFAGRLLADIRPFEIASVVYGLADQGQAFTARHVLTAMRDICNEALMQGWMDANPALHVKRPRAPIQRKRLTLEQWLEVRAAGERNLPPWFGPMLTLALVSGQRRSDLVRMRKDHCWDGLLHVEQYKSGARIALPLALRLDVLGVTLEEAIEACCAVGQPGEYVLRKSGGGRLGAQSLSHRFATARELAGITVEAGSPPSLHEVRSLSERLYRAQGVDTQTLLGHRHQHMTDQYNDDRGLTAASWKVLQVHKMDP